MPYHVLKVKERAALDRRIWRMQVDGFSLREIAEELYRDGTTPRMQPKQRIQEALRREITRHTSDLGPDEYLIVETANLNEARRAAHRRAFVEGKLVDIKAAELWLKLTERYHRLAGLDKPIKIDLAEQLRIIAAEEGLDENELVAIAERYATGT